MSEAADRGKWAEGKVKDFLKSTGDMYASFDWERIRDARSAGGRFHPQIYDFAFYYPNTHGGIEVKTVKHDCRLPHQNFGTDQVARLRKRLLAGGQVIVLIYHSTNNTWRVEPLTTFFHREGGSWLLTSKTYSTCNMALLSTGLFTEIEIARNK